MVVGPAGVGHGSELGHRANGGGAWQQVRSQMVDRRGAVEKKSRTILEVRGTTRGRKS